jgi:hypothetical protein
VSLSDKPRQSAEYRLESIDDELLLFHPGRTTIIYCNSTASLVWQLCNGERTVQEIVNLLQDAYPEASENMTGDIVTTLQRFAHHGAIEYV